MTIQGFKRHARRVSTDENERPAHRRRLASLRNLQTFSQRRRLPPFRRQPGTTVRFGPATSEEDSWIAFRSSSAPESPPLIFPRYLDRGIYREISKAAIAAIDPDLADVPADYITPRLEVIGPDMLQVIDSVEATPDKESLPAELSVIVNETCSDQPTHVLAVFSSSLPGAPRPVQIHPIHHIIWATQCASLPPLATTTLPTPDEIGQITIPVITLKIPCLDTFSLVARYLYTKDTLHLLGMLLPTRNATPAWLLDIDLHFDADDPELQDFRVMLGKTYTHQKLVEHICTLNGLWKNVIALGMSDERLWDVMGLAWDVLLGALSHEYPVVNEVQPTVDTALKELSLNEGF